MIISSCSGCKIVRWSSHKCYTCNNFLPLSR